MNYLDVIILLPILYGIVRGLLRGFVQELTSILAIIAGVGVAKYLAPWFSVKILEVMNMPEWLGHALAYLLLFAGVALLCMAFSSSFRKFLKTVHLKWLDKLAGAIFDGLKWALIMSVVLNMLTFVDPYYEIFNAEAKRTSVAYEPTLRVASTTWNKANDLLPVVREQLGE